MLFGDLPMVLIDGLIASKVFSVHKAFEKNFTENVFICQFALSLLSLFRSFITIDFQRKALDEDPFEWLLLCLKSKIGWIPYGNYLETGMIFTDINYGAIELKKSGGFMTSNETGFYG